MKRRSLKGFAVAVAVALVLPSFAGAKLYAGPFVPQVNDDGVEIGVKRVKGEPRQVTPFEFHNVATGSPCNGSNIFFRSMKVDDKLRFHGSGHPGQAGNADWPPTPNLTVTIHGRFKQRNEKIVGTLRLKGTGGCSADTGPLPYVALAVKRTGTKSGGRLSALGSPIWPGF